MWSCNACNWQGYASQKWKWIWWFIYYFWCGLPWFFDGWTERRHSKDFGRKFKWRFRWVIRWRLFHILVGDWVLFSCWVEDVVVPVKWSSPCLFQKAFERYFRIAINERTYLISNINTYLINQLWSEPPLPYPQIKVGVRQINHFRIYLFKTMLKARVCRALSHHVVPIYQLVPSTFIFSHSIIHPGNHQSCFWGWCYKTIKNESLTNQTRGWYSMDTILR